MAKQNWWNLLSKSALDDLHGMMRDPELTYTEVGKLYGKTVADLSYYAHKLGLPPRSVRKGSLSLAGRNGAVTTLSQVDKELADLAAQQETLRQKQEALKARRAELQVRFERVGPDLLVYGVADGPLTAPIEAWMQFLVNEGPRKLREFVAQNAKKGGTQ